MVCLTLGVTFGQCAPSSKATHRPHRQHTVRPLYFSVPKYSQMKLDHNRNDLWSYQGFICYNCTFSNWFHIQLFLHCSVYLKAYTYDEMKIVYLQLDLLYEEAIYTVVNRVGVPSPEYVTSEEDLFSYLQKVETFISLSQGDRSSSYDRNLCVSSA